MNRLLFTLVAITFASIALKAAQPEINPSHIDAYVTPYYDSKGPAVSVGRFSSGLASAKEDDFLTTITEMKKDWDLLSIGAGSLVFSWIRPRWEASVVLGLSCCTPRMPFISWWGLTSTVTLLAIWMDS